MKGNLQRRIALILQSAGDHWTFNETYDQMAKAIIERVATMPSDEKIELMRELWRVRPPT